MTATALLSSINITDIYRNLGGDDVRKGRGQAFWRNGDGLNVSLNDKTGTWYDFVTHEHGGILDLVQRVNGGSRVEALRWVADLHGLQLGEQSPAQRREYRIQHHQDQADLPAARSWRHAALALADLLLKTMASNDPGRYDQTQFALSLRATGDAALLAEYRHWREQYPDLTVAIGAVMEKIENAEVAALFRFLQQPSEGSDAPY